MNRVFVPVIAAFALASCSTSIDPMYKETQTVKVFTPGVASAQCQLSTHDERFNITTPGTIEVSKSDQAINYVCGHADYGVTEGTITPEKERWAFSNVVNKVTPGSKYDFGGEAKFSYPEKVRITLKPLNTIASAKTTQPVAQPIAEPVITAKAEPVHSMPGNLLMSLQDIAPAAGGPDVETVEAVTGPTSLSAPEVTITEAEPVISAEKTVKPVVQTSENDSFQKMLKETEWVTPKQFR